jgi:hypothetical protein
MSQPGKTAAVLLAVSLTALAIVSCSSPPEQPILNQFFTASRLRDSSSLENFSTVILDPATVGTVTSFSISEISPEQHTPLALKTLGRAQADAMNADEEVTKRKLAFQTENMDLIRRAQDPKATLKPKDKEKWAEIQAAWSNMQKEGAATAKKLNDARARLAAERNIVMMSASNPGAPLDVATLVRYDGEMVSKKVTVAARVRLPSGGSGEKTIIVAMQRAMLKGDREITGKWIITSAADASAPKKATSTS